MCRVGWGKTPTVSILRCSYILPTSRKTCSPPDGGYYMALYTTLMLHSPFIYFCCEDAEIQKDKWAFFHTPWGKTPFGRGKMSMVGILPHPPPSTIIHCLWPNKLTILILSVWLKQIQYKDRFKWKFDGWDGPAVAWVWDRKWKIKLIGL